MTISSTTNKSGPYIENGVTTEFEYAFKIEDETHIQVVRAAGGVETILALGTHYTVTGVGSDTGNIVLVAPGNGSTLTLVRDAPFVQELDLENQGAYFAEQVEAALDLAVARDQQLQEQLNRTVKVPVSSDPTDIETLVSGVVALLDAVDDVTVAASISTQVVAVAANAVNINTVAGISGAVTTVANISANVTTVAGIAGAVVVTATIDDEIVSAAMIAGQIVTVAGISTNVTTVAGMQSNIATVVANMTAIQNAPAAASAAAQSAAAAAASAASVDASKIVHVLPDTFTPAEKGQARANIGAGTSRWNELTNGNFDNWQRGASFTVAAGATVLIADRWKVQNTTNVSATVTSYGLSGAESAATGNAVLGVNITVSGTPTTGDIIVRQLIENVATLAGKSATLTMHAARSSGAGVATLAAQVQQVFGSGGSPTSSALNGVLGGTLDTTFSKQQTTFFVPAIAGKTIGTNSALLVQLSYSPRSSGAVLLTHASLVEGDATAEADPFSPRHAQQERAMCERYFFKRVYGIGDNVCVGQAYSTTSAFGKLFDLPTEMRAPPSISATASHFGPSNAGGSGTPPSFSAGTTTYKNGGVFFDWAGASGLVAGNATTIKANAVTVITADAEL